MERFNTFNSNTELNTRHYIGVWVTRDGEIRHEFLPNGRYTESRGHILNAFTGYYSVLGNHVEYLDDTGFAAEGDFRDGVFYYSGTVLLKEAV
jgi:hypothetical protein